MACGGSPSLIVAAIDFGTAYSGYAFSFHHTFKDDPTKISTNTWNTGSGGLMSLKTATCALFEPGKKFHSFGFQAEDNYSDLALDGNHRGWYFFKCFKMDLFEKVKLNRNFKLEDTLGKALPAIDVFAGSIAFLKNHLMKTCKDRIPDSHENDVRWVLTVPAIWDDAAKQFMREAAVKAGISEERLVMALEPEAASLYCRYLPVEKFSGISEKGFKPFQPGSKYLVLDAGGGTIDITVHEVKGNNTLSEIFKASGGNWGGTYVDKAFRNVLADIVGNDVIERFVKEQTADYLDLFRSFEVKKRSFETKLTSKVMFKVPVSLNEIFRDARGKDIKDVIGSTKYAGDITWTGDKLRLAPEIVNGVFDEPCESIVNHLENLFQKPQLADVNMILMVGGFSESLMLQEYVKTGFPDKRVIVPDEPGLVVLKGAVIFGHDTGAISERKSKYTYGIDTTTDFDELYHPEEKILINDDGLRLCEDIFDIHVKIGQTIITGESQYTQTYDVTNADQTQMDFEVFASKKRNPKFVTDPGCISIGTLTIDIGGYGMDRNAEVCLLFGETEIHVTAIDAQTGETTSAKFDFLSDDKASEANVEDSDDDDSSDDEDDDDDECYDDEDLGVEIGEQQHIVQDFLGFEDSSDYEEDSDYE